MLFFFLIKTVYPNCILTVIFNICLTTFPSQTKPSGEKTIGYVMVGSVQFLEEYYYGVNIGQTDRMAYLT